RRRHARARAAPEASTDRDRPARRRRATPTRAGTPVARRPCSAPSLPSYTGRKLAATAAGDYDCRMNEIRRPDKPLRRGWTTGACATAAARAAYEALLTGRFPDPVTIRLPQGQRPSFPLATTSLDTGAATAGITKDAGDDPDVTHGALVLATVA